MTKIAILHYSCPPVVGGVEEVVWQQASLFHRNGHPVKVIAGSGSQNTEEFAIEINPLLASRNPEVLHLQQNAIENHVKIQSIADNIFEYLKSSLLNFDILIAHNVISMHFNLPLTMALHKLADCKKTKVISWNHDSPYFYKNYAEEFEREPWSLLKRYNPNFFYVTISPSRAEEFQKLYRKKKEIMVIPNGIDPFQIFRLNSKTIQLIEENSLFEADLLLIQPSRLHPRKNIELSIKVVKALNDLGTKAKLILTGAYDPHQRKTPSYYHKLKKLAESLHVEKDIIVVAKYIFKSDENIALDSATIHDLYHISDILFLPSTQEGFGIPLLEAGMLKLPIASSDIAPFKSIAKENACYFSVTDNPEEIAKKILHFLAQLAPHGMYRNIIRNYLWDNIYHRFLKTLLEHIRTYKENT
jgi:glycosyltransferase involved in cell wall biosynthesis